MSGQLNSKQNSVSTKQEEDNDEEEAVASPNLPAWKRYWAKCQSCFTKSKDKPKPKRQWRREKVNDSDNEDDNSVQDVEINETSISSNKKGEPSALEQQDLQEQKERSACVTIQCLIRRFLSRVYRRQKMEEAIIAAELHAGNETASYQSRKRAKLESRAARVGLEHFTVCYVQDLLSTSSMFIIQTVAITLIQKHFRGHLVRRKIYLARNKIPPKPKEKRRQYMPTVARRVWARKDFTPEGGWPAMKWSVITYDIHEHVEVPPKGRDFGLKTRKVQLPARSQRTKDIVVSDTNSWVGIPVNVEPISVIKRRAVLRQQELALMEGVSPYVGPQFRPIVVKPPAPLKGVAAIKALGWNSKMIDRRKGPAAGKRAYKIIDPYSNAALAADLSTVAMSKTTNANLLTLGSSLDQPSVSSTVSDSSNRHNESISKRGIGMNVWSGSLQDKSSMHVPGQYHILPTDSTELLTHTQGKVVQLITPIRGTAKPLSSRHKAALRDAKLLPEDLEEQYALEQIMQQARPPSNRSFSKLQNQRKEDHFASEVAMQDPMKWTQTVRGRLRLSAAALATSLQTQHSPKVAVDNDPWSRSTYVPKRELPSKVLVWPKQAKQSYKIKYSWLPQTLVKDGAMAVYADIRDETRKLQRNATLTDKPRTKSKS